MAADNKTLGRFQLTDIPPAPRGVPQIEVTFDIDKNGIVTVKAKDLGTQKEQNITIESSSGLSDEEIEQMVKDAEANAEADEKRKEEAELRNGADQLVFQVDKTVEELGENVQEDEKTQIADLKAALEKAIEEDNLDDMKAKKEELEQLLQTITVRMYEQAQQAQQAQGGEQGPADDGVVDADFEEVKEDK